jgi:hypothetical protein
MPQEAWGRKTGESWHKKAPFAFIPPLLVRLYLVRATKKSGISGVWRIYSEIIRTILLAIKSKP